MTHTGPRQRIPGWSLGGRRWEHRSQSRAWYRTFSLVRTGPPFSGPTSPRVSCLPPRAR